MKRRSFLTLLSSGVVALCLPDVEWVPTTPSGVLAPAASETLTDIGQITVAVLREMTTRLPDLRGTFLPGSYLIGHEGMTHQWNVGLAPEGDNAGLTLKRSIVPAAAALAARVHEKELRRFGALPIPSVLYAEDAAVATDERSGLSVRGLRQYQLGDRYGMDEGWLYRFDVLGGKAA